MAKIIIADDDPIARSILYETLNSAGHEVLAFEDGLEVAYELKYRPNVDLLITDVMMPYVDGDMLLKLCRGVPELTQMPIILTSGVIGPKKITSFLEDGFTFFIPKPIKKDYVMSYVNKCVAPVRARNEVNL